MRVLYLTKYTQHAASSRMRSYQYFPDWEKAGFEITVKPFFDEQYLQQLYTGKKNGFTILKAYGRRFKNLFGIKKYDRVVIEKEIFPFLPAWAEYILKLMGVQYIVDYDDAIFHNYDQSTNPLIKSILGNKIAKVMRNSNGVVAGNSYLAQYALTAGAKRVEIIPTVIDLERYALKEENIDKNKFVFGWIGTKSTFEKHLAPEKDWIIQFLEENADSEFYIIGIPENQNWHHRVKWIPWTEETEVNALHQLDVGIMPLQDSLWERGKCAYKLIQYAACGISGVASPIGMNKEVIIPNQSGLLAQSEKEWLAAITSLKNNKEQRQYLGLQARMLVEQKYSRQMIFQKWVQILKENNGQ